MRAIRTGIDRHEDDVAIGAGEGFPTPTVQGELDRLRRVLRDLGEALGVWDTGFPPTSDRDYSLPLTAHDVEHARMARGQMLSGASLALMGLVDKPLPEWFLDAEPPREWSARPWEALACELAATFQLESEPNLFFQVQDFVRDLDGRAMRAQMAIEWIQPRGRPPDRAARALAFRLAYIWHRHAGLPLKRNIAGGGPWFDFVRTVFEAAKIGSSGQRYARELQGFSFSEDPSDE